MDIKGMGKLFLKGLLFIALFFVLDRAFGFVNVFFEHKALEHSPYSMVTEYTMEKVDSDVVIMGASEANHSYVCSVLGDSLNLSVYNCGKDGQRFYYQNAMINGILDRYNPKLIIWSVGAGFLSTPSQEDMDNLSQLNPYYNSKEYCREAIHKKSEYENLKMQLKSYAFNSRILVFLFKSFTSDYAYKEGGYAPLYGQMDSSVKRKTRVFKDNLNAESEKVFNNTLKRCREKGVEVAFVLTPRYEAGDYRTIQFDKMKQIITRYDYPLFEEFYYHKDILKPELFKDASHVNDSGAHIFTRMLAQKLKPLIENK